MLAGSSDMYNGFTSSLNPQYILYTSDNCVTAYPKLGFVKVSPFDIHTYSCPSFTSQLNSTVLLNNIVNYLHSRYPLEGVRFQVFLFKGVHLNTTSGLNEYYYYIYLTSSVALSLSSYDMISNVQQDMGCYLLLLSGYMPTFDLFDSNYRPTLLFPNYVNPCWHSDSVPPSYAPHDIIDILNIFSNIVVGINTNSDPFFVSGDMAFFDSIDADFGEIDVPIDDPHTIISEILDQDKHVEYFVNKYPQIMETFYDNMFALISYSLKGQYPYLAVE